MLSRKKDIYKHALAASKYANSFILKSQTALTSNDLKTDRRAALEKAIDDTRNLYERSFFDLSDFYLYHFETDVQTVKKYSIGNCNEYAMLALDYFILNQEKCTDFNAEIFEIEGGDHVFLVVGRDPNSDPNNPLTWGGDAYICDPWSNQVYQATEYRDKDKLNNFYTYENKYGQIINAVEPFDIDKHKLKIKGSFNKNYIIQIKSIDNLKQNFATKLNCFMNILDEYTNRLKQLVELEKNQTAKEAMQNKLVEIQTSLSNYNALKIETLSEPYSDYEKTKRVLEKELLHTFKNGMSSIGFNADQLNKLESRIDTKSLRSKALMFFNIPTPATVAVKNIINESTQQFNELIHPRPSTTMR